MRKIFIMAKSSREKMTRQFNSSHIKFQLNPGTYSFVLNYTFSLNYTFPATPIYLSIL